jgi:16S rRNA processing protein RimM
MNDAELLAGQELRIAEVEGEAERLGEGEYYHRDLIGCAVVTESGESIGEVTAIEGDRSATRLVVRSRRNEVLIPLADAICTVDLKGKRITVRPPEGPAGTQRRMALSRRRSIARQRNRRSGARQSNR